MATSIGSPFGKLVGKLGSAVGFTWKDKNAVRSYAIPANPNTVAQQAQRGMMSKTVQIGRTLLATLCQKFFDPFARGMSGFNAFVKINLDAMFPAWDATKLIVATGSLEGISALEATYDTASGDVSWEWDSVCTSNGLGTDKVVFVTYNEDNGMSYIDDSGKLRSAGIQTTVLPAGLTNTDLRCLAFAYREAGTTITLISPSSNIEPSAV